MVIRILIADDHLMLAETFKILVEQQADMQVVGLSVDGRDAVKQVEALRPDIVVMDLTMPEMNGADATRARCWRSTRAAAWWCSPPTPTPSGCAAR